MVQERYGKQAADAIEWSVPRRLCIAGDVTCYDEHAVEQINRNIELIRYADPELEMLYSFGRVLLPYLPQDPGGGMVKASRS